MLDVLASVRVGTTNYPWWWIAVFVGGSGGIGYAVWKVIMGARSMAAILRVLTGEEGGKGKREVKPLVDVVDGLVEDVQHQSKQLKTVQLDLKAVQDEITPNGGNTDKLGDRVLRTEENQRELHDALTAHAAADNEVQTKLSEGLDRVEAKLGSTPES